MDEGRKRIPLIAALGDQSGKPDAYSLALVRMELQMRSGGRRVLHGFSQKRLARLGDGVSIGILKLLDDEVLSKPQTVRDFLPIIRDAFASPEFISIETDKTPRVTLFLLDFLGEKVTDAQTKQQIEETVDFVKSKAGD
jgi:hypothetical protein